MTRLMKQPSLSVAPTPRRRQMMCYTISTRTTATERCIAPAWRTRLRARKRRRKRRRERLPVERRRELALPAGERYGGPTCKPR